MSLPKHIQEAPTPRTDEESALHHKYPSLEDTKVVSSLVAQQLEREIIYLREVLENHNNLIARLERECLVPDFAHDAFGSCPICKALAAYEQLKKDLAS